MPKVFRNKDTFGIWKVLGANDVEARHSDDRYENRDCSLPASRRACICMVHDNQALDD